MRNVSKWEIVGFPAAALFEAAYELGLFAELGIGVEQLPRVMLLTYFLVALLRSALQSRGTKPKQG